MTATALHFGKIAPSDLPIRRSGLRWLVPDGHVAKAGELVACCNIGIVGEAANAFADERTDLQIALALPKGGRIRHRAGLSRGGYIDRLPSIEWVSDDSWGHLEGYGTAPVEPRILYLAGRRFSPIAGDQTGPLSGWHERVRAWWGDCPPLTLLAAGTCEQSVFLRSGHNIFGDIFAQTAHPLHLVLTHDEPLVPNALICLEQMGRSAEDIAAIRRDLIETLLTEGSFPDASDMLLLAALLRGLETSPLDEGHAILLQSGVHHLPPARMLSLSLGAEFAQVLRHRRLGYTINCHHYRIREAGPAVRHWLRSNCELVTRSVDDVRAGYEALLARLAGRTTLFVVNCFSSQSYERVSNYGLLDASMLETLTTVRAKHLNLMLHDLSRGHDLHIIDQDAIAADLGMATHVPDGTHASRQLADAVRGALLKAMAARLSSRSESQQPIP